MSAWLLSLVVPFFVGLLWHGLSLKLSVALAGEDSPSFLRAALVSWMGGLLGALGAMSFAWTFGWFTSLFIGAWLTAAIGIAISLLTTTFVYKKGLKLTFPTAMGVTGIHAVLTFLVNGVLGAVAYGMMFGCHA